MATCQRENKKQKLKILIALGQKLYLEILTTILNDLFFVIGNRDIASYANNNTPYIAVDNIDDLIKSLEEALAALFQWFDNNLLEQSPKKTSFIDTQQ